MNMLSPTARTGSRKLPGDRFSLMTHKLWLGKQALPTNLSGFDGASIQVTGQRLTDDGVGAVMAVIKSLKLTSVSLGKGGLTLGGFLTKQAGWQLLNIAATVAVSGEGYRVELCLSTGKNNVPAVFQREIGLVRRGLS